MAVFIFTLDVYPHIIEWINSVAMPLFNGVLPSGEKGVDNKIHAPNY